MAGATMRVGGFSALGGLVGVGVGLGRFVGIGDGGGGVTVHLGKSSGVGPSLLVSDLTALVGVGDGVGVSVAVGGYVSASLLIGVLVYLILNARN